MSEVIVKNAEDYHGNLKIIVYDVLDRTIGNMYLDGLSVLVKPNLLSAASPEKAVTTHPRIIRFVCEYLAEKNAGITISDSPAVGSFKKIIKECGIVDELKGIPVKFTEFKKSRQVEVNAPFHRIELASDALDAGLIINLPKLKTHSQMLLTLGVKNLFGCVVGMRKPQWHLRTGVDTDMFARLLIEIYLSLKPSITILDGILGMEGQGPGKRGIPKHLGVILASEDAIALDYVVAQMLNIDPMSVPVNRAAGNMGLVRDMDINGEIRKVTGFLLPKTADLLFGPAFLHRFMRKNLTQRPEHEEDLCEMCLECINHCPAAAISTLDNSLRFDYDRCIRCYCCVEICPFGAMKTTQPLMGRIFSRIIK